MQDKMEEFLQRLRAPLQDLVISWIVSHLSLSAGHLMALLRLLTSRPDLGTWPDCWVSVEFLRAPIPRKRSGSTTTTKFNKLILSQYTNILVDLATTD